MTELEMAESAGKNIKLKNGNVIEGFAIVFTQAIDNEPELTVIDIKDKTGRFFGFLQTKIESIEILE